MIDSIFLEKVAKGEAYIKTVTGSGITAKQTEGTSLVKSTVDEGWVAIIRKAKTTADPVQIKVYINDQEVGEKYGGVIDCSAMNLFADGLDLGIKVNGGDEYEIKAFGVGGDQTLNAYAFVIVYMKEGKS